MNLEGKVAVVTGGGRGIGLAYAKELGKAGAAVVIADIDPELADSAVAELTALGYRAAPVVVDVSSKASTLEMASAVKEVFGAAHILINNAAIYHSIRFDSQMSVDIDYWRRVFSVNVDGALLCTQAIAPMMIEAGWGRVVIQSSASAYFGTGGVYGCSKMALIGLTQAFARELGPHGITVNSIAPGMIFTEATMSAIAPTRREQATAEMFIKKQAQPDDLLSALRFVVSEDSGWVTAQTIIVDGGMVTRL